MSLVSSAPGSSSDSIVTLFFDGLEIIYFVDAVGGAKSAVVLLPKQNGHTPSLDILKIVDNIPTPLPHDIDISEGMTIGLKSGPQGVKPRDNSFHEILNPQNGNFHGGKLKFKKKLPDKPIIIDITDGDFFSAVTTARFPTRFEVNDTVDDYDIPPFADVVGADITLSPGDSVLINTKSSNESSEKPPEMLLQYEPGTRYCVLISNGPTPGHHHVPTHSNPRHQVGTHFYFYYDLLVDVVTGLQFDLQRSGRGEGIPPQNCDPIFLEPPPTGP